LGSVSEHFQLDFRH